MKMSPVVRMVSGLALGAGLFAGACAVAQDKPSDAQVEANVLKALAGAPELSTQNIQTSTVYGEVTITGNVHDEGLRTKAENIVARVPGVKKVVDELALGDAPAQDPNAPQNADNGGMPPQDAQGQGMVLQSDGTYAPAEPPANQTGMAPPPADQQAQDQGQGYPQGDPNAQPPAGRRPLYQGNQGGNQAPPPDGYAQGQPGNYPPQGYGQPGPGQRGGMPVVVPPGALLTIRINRGIDSQHIKPGTPFDGTVMNDIVAGGAVAIPRGTQVFGVVADAEKTKALSGRGELGLQITGIQLGGQTFPVQSDIWTRTGRDKTASTVNHGVVGGLLGAVAGGILGGGKGAAIGAGVGAGVGVASSAGSPGGQVIVPPESILNFRTAAPTNVVTVGQQEMGRLAYAAGLGPQPRYYRRAVPPPPPYAY